MVLHDIRDYAHGYVAPTVRCEINRALDAYDDLDAHIGSDPSQLRGILLALASEAETLAQRLAARSESDAPGTHDASVAVLASRCRSAIAAAG